ncbi:MAG: PD-(D/E)XK nuclease-like domain-containing protein [Smithella sp.]|jgi:hypothetical protein
MKLLDNNYYSPQMNKDYFSVSQYKDFIFCEAMAMAKINGLYQEPMTRAMLVGSFVDAYFEGTFKQFLDEHPEIFTQKDGLRAEFKKANEIIDRVKRDKLFMQFLSGEKQKIFTAEMFGVNWKIKMDSYCPKICIVDLKAVKNYKSMPYWRYDIQGAVYQEVTWLNTGDRLPFYLAAATKERVTNFDVFQIPQETLDWALEEVRINIERFKMVKNGEIATNPCGECDYCKSIKSALIRNYDELLGGM